MTNFIMLVGLPGCGKSTLAKEYKEKGFNIHSSDAIREELSGDENNQDINQEVFSTLHKRVKEDLTKGKDCVYDATNISHKRRKAFLDELKSIECKKVCIFVATPYEVCLNQNDMRPRRVPEHVIEKMYRNFDVPALYEGWDEIKVHYNDDKYKNLYGSWSQFVYDSMDYDQETPHHTTTLGEHCRECGTAINLKDVDDNDIFWDLHIAGMLHDNGKPFCKTFKNSKGEEDTKAHYYNHENVGSYNSFFYDVWSDKEEDRLLIATLIRWHMQMYFIEKQPHIEEKYRKMFGESLWFYLNLLHNADKEAH